MRPVKAHAAAKLPPALFNLFFLVLYAQKKFGTKEVETSRPTRQPPDGPMYSCIINGNAYKEESFLKIFCNRSIDVITRNDDDTADTNFHRAHVTR